MKNPLKRGHALLLALVMVLSLAACSTPAAADPGKTADPKASTPADASTPATTGSTPLATTPKKIGFFCPGSVNDNGFNASGYNGVLKIVEKYGTDMVYRENAQASEYEEIARGFADAGCDLIIAHGSASGDAVLTVAEEYPDIRFLVVANTTAFNGSNVGCLTLDGVQGGFICGALAALTTKSNHIGSVVLEIISAKQLQWGFEAGAKYINPDIEVSNVYLTNNSDSAGAQQAAYSLFGGGIDVLLQNCDPAGNSVYTAAQEHGGYVICTTSDHNALAPDVILGNGTQLFPEAILATFDRIVDGTWKPESVVLGVTEGSVGFQFNEALVTSALSAENRAKFDQLMADIESGTIDCRALATKTLGFDPTAQ